MSQRDLCTCTLGRVSAEWRDYVNASRHFAAGDAKHDAAIVVVIRLPGHVADQAVANKKVAVRAAVGRGDENTVTLREFIRLVDDLEIFDVPAAGVADVQGAHLRSVGPDHGAGR